MKIGRIIQNSIKRTGVITAMVTSSFLPTHATKPAVDAFIPSGHKVELAVTNSSFAENIINKGKTFVADFKAPKDNFNITTEHPKDLLTDVKTNNVSSVAKDSSETLKAEPVKPIESNKAMLPPKAEATIPEPEFEIPREEGFPDEPKTRKKSKLIRNLIIGLATVGSAIGGYSYASNGKHAKKPA